MRRLIIATLALALVIGFWNTASANDQECMTADVTWDGDLLSLVNVHHASIGVRTAIVGDYLWTQYNTTDRYWEDENKQVLSTHIPVGVSHIEACPDGLVTLTSPAPPPTDDAELGPAVVVIDVIAYWEGLLSHNFDPY